MKTLIDEKGRLFGKGSVIDLGILLLVVMVALGAYVKFFVLEQTSVVTEVFPVRYTLEVVGVRDWTVNNIQEGDTLFVTGVAVGTVVSVETRPHQTLIAGRDGEVWWGEVPERYVAYVEISATATLNDGRYLVSRTVPMAEGNSPTSFHTRFTQFRATVREIQPYDQ